MGRLYTSTFTGVAASAAQDLFSLLTPADLIAEVHELHIAQDSDVGDSAEIIEIIRVRSGQTTVGSGGTAPAMERKEGGDAAATCTVRANDTTQASSGTIIAKYHWGWNVRVPFEKVWTPETRPLLIPSTRMTFELMANPSSAITVSGTLVFMELG